MPTFIYRLTPARADMPNDPTDEEVRVIGEHLAYLCEAARAGKLHLAGRTMNESGVWGICIFDANSDEEALEFMNNDPGVKHGVQLAELFPFKTALWGAEPEGCFDFQPN